MLKSCKSVKRIKKAKHGARPSSRSIGRRRTERIGDGTSTNRPTDRLIKTTDTSADGRTDGQETRCQVDTATMSIDSSHKNSRVYPHSLAGRSAHTRNNDSNNLRVTISSTSFSLPCSISPSPVNTLLFDCFSPSNLYQDGFLRCVRSLALSNVCQVPRLDLLSFSPVRACSVHRRSGQCASVPLFCPRPAGKESD